jgi:hypothetical protein
MQFNQSIRVRSRSSQGEPPSSLEERTLLEPQSLPTGPTSRLTSATTTPCREQRHCFTRNGAARRRDQPMTARNVLEMRKFRSQACATPQFPHGELTRSYCVPRNFYWLVDLVFALPGHCVHAVKPAPDNRGSPRYWPLTEGQRGRGLGTTSAEEDRLAYGNHGKTAASGEVRSGV